jgi:predicted Zn finger-like uncharacterized protein
VRSKVEDFSRATAEEVSLQLEIFTGELVSFLLGGFEAFDGPCTHGLPVTHLLFEALVIPLQAGNWSRNWLTSVRNWSTRANTAGSVVWSRTGWSNRSPMSIPSHNRVGNPGRGWTANNGIGEPIHNLFVFDGSNQSCEMDISSVSQNDNNRYDLHYQLIIREMGKYLQFAPEAEASPPPRPVTAYPVQRSIPRRRGRRRGDDDDPARERRDAQARRQTTTLILVILGVIFVLPIIACGGIFFFAALTPNNAQCPGCGKEFHISNEHRGNNSMWTREYRCPRCHNSWPAAVLYK